jgi:hypothetical protein
MNINQLIPSMVIMIFILGGCATMQTSNRCLTYTTRGATSEEWAPTKYYQTESKLIIQLSAYVKYTPTLEVVDTEFGQPYKIDYTYDLQTQRITVEDNYDEYILSRKEYDELSVNRVYIRCNREALLSDK